MLATITRGDVIPSSMRVLHRFSKPGSHCAEQSWAAVAISVLVLSVIAKPVAGQDGLRGDERLKAIREIALVVDPAVEDDTYCGLSQESVRLDVARLLLDAGIKVSTQPGIGLYHNLAVEYLTVRPRTLCVTAVFLQLSTNVNGNTLIDLLEEKGGAPRQPSIWGDLVLWRESILVSTESKDGHRDRVLAEIRRLVVDFATRVKLMRQ